MRACSRVQVWLPRVSTSGGHCAVREDEGFVVVVAGVGCDAGVADCAVEGAAGVLVEDFIMAIHAADEVQVLHLCWCQLDCATLATMSWPAYGLPSLSKTTPFGSGAFVPSVFVLAPACGNAFLSPSSPFGCSSSRPGIVVDALQLSHNLKAVSRRVRGVDSSSGQRGD